MAETAIKQDESDAVKAPPESGDVLAGNPVPNSDSAGLLPTCSRYPDKQQPLELVPDFLSEDRHEFVAKLAYKLWEERGRPFGSPDVDWFAAERAVYSSLVASGLVAPSENDPQHMAEKIYW